MPMIRSLRTLELHPKVTERVAYEDTDYYQITRGFLRDRKTMLKRLFKKESELDL